MINEPKKAHVNKFINLMFLLHIHFEQKFP